MPDTNRAMLTEAQMAVFLQKLSAWSATLTAAERAFLEQMLADAADAANDDISGYINLSSLADDDATGYAALATDATPLGRAVVGYASGLARAETEFSPTTFFDDSDA